MDHEVRLAAFHWLEEYSQKQGDVFPRNTLEKGFMFRGDRVTLLGPQGIWKPKRMQLPLSITTIDDGPYSDSVSGDGFLNYKYRGNNPTHRDNIGLRELMKSGTPLIYFLKIVKGKYLATWPVFVQNDDADNLTFTISVDDKKFLQTKSSNRLSENESSYGRRSYITSNVLVRLHQRSFREKVMIAYQSQCALCHLRHSELLDAAHIIPDKDDNGEPIIQNGISLCKIHHAAFDKFIIGISPDFEIKVREDILIEVDGPMLKHGIQSLDRTKMILPKRKGDWPDQDRLSIRYEEFLKTG